MKRWRSRATWPPIFRIRWRLRCASPNRPERNRGVRKAPFVVLVGADMPSVLAEISFISNPVDEQLLKKPENRQRAAEGLFSGIERYLRSVNSLTTTISPSASVAPPQ